MARLGDVAAKVRSKNAGPFTVTLDVFFNSIEDYEEYAGRLSCESLAELYRLDPADIHRFELPDLMAIKFSIPRSVVQGGRLDRDMHGAQLAILCEEVDLEWKNSCFQD